MHRKYVKMYGFDQPIRMFDFCLIPRVGQNHIHTVYIRYFWQGNHRIYGHIRCIYTVLANLTYPVVVARWLAVKYPYIYTIIFVRHMLVLLACAEI
jgi:hypothetical protein